MSRTRRFIEQLEDKITNPNDGDVIREKIRSNDRSRLFDDLPDHFYSIFDDFFLPDTNHLLDILRHATARNTDEGDVFIYARDKNEIKAWCKTIMHRGALQLLDEENNIAPSLLNALDKKPTEITNRELICAYFAAINQCVLTYIAATIDETPQVHHIQFRAFMQFMNDRTKTKQSLNNFSLWAQEVLNERKDPSLLKGELTTGEKVGLGVAVGTLTLAGVVAALFAATNKNSSRDDNNNRQDHHRPGRPPGGFNRY